MVAYARESGVAGDRAHGLCKVLGADEELGFGIDCFARALVTAPSKVTACDDTGPDVRVHRFQVLALRSEFR